MDVVYSPPRALDLSLLKTPQVTSLKMTRCVPSVPTPQWINTLVYLEIREPRHPFHEIIPQLVSLNQLYLDFGGLLSLPECRIVSQSLARLHLDFWDADVTALLDELTTFDTPHLTQLYIHRTHGRQLSAFFSSNRWARLEFPAVTSVAFTNPDSYHHQHSCDEENIYHHHDVSFHNISRDVLLGSYSRMSGLENRIRPIRYRFAAMATVEVSCASTHARRRGGIVRSSSGRGALETEPGRAAPVIQALNEPVGARILGRERGSCGVV
ncbi:hypothetical protein FB45DRAFT_918153, partial [Roridomyces roridus]